MSYMCPIPKDTLFTITSGVYSDYEVHGVFRAVKSLNTAMLRIDYLCAHPEQRGVGFRERDFLGWLARQNLIEPVESMEWFLGDRDCHEMSVSSQGGRLAIIRGAKAPAGK